MMEPLTGEVIEQIRFYRDGFFGYGETGDFAYFSAAHFAPILLMLLAVFLIYRFRNRLKGWKWDEDFRFLLGALCLITFFSYYCRVLYAGTENSGRTTLLTKLPFEFCDLNICLTAFMVMKKSRKLFGISFLFTVTFGILPLCTPAVILKTGPTYFKYYQFWLMHILPFVIDFYMLFVHDFRLKKSDVFRAFALAEVLLLVAIYMNARIPDANFCFIARETDGASLANIMPESMLAKWAIYTLAGLLLFSLAFWIYRAVLKRTQKTKPPR